MNADAELDRATALAEFWDSLRARNDGFGASTIAENHGAIRRREGPLSWTVRVRSHEAQAELLIESLDRELNEAIFRDLFARRDKVEAALGRDITWDEKPGRQRFRIASAPRPGGWRDRARWKEVQGAVANDLRSLESALRPYLAVTDTNDSKQLPGPIIEQVSQVHDAEGESGKPWTDLEIRLVTDAYFDLLAAELRGERPIKVLRIRELQRLIPARSLGSIERKMSNISAVLDHRQQPWIDGYKPLAHYQTALGSAVVERIDQEVRLRETLAEYQSSTLPAPAAARRATDDLLVDAPSVERRHRRPPIGLTTGPFGAMQDFRNRQLGRAGEELVFDAERESLARHGRDDLADRVVWTSTVEGDGAGYDIASFRFDGTPLHIEVKTTNFGSRTPFFVTRWEVDVSRTQSAIYSLYRVFDFRSDPRIFRLDGSIADSARLEPSVFVGVPR